MSQYSKIITALPLFVGFLFLGLDYFAGFEINDSHIQLIEFMIGSTVIGGVGNSGFKKYIAYKEKIKNG